MAHAQHSARALWEAKALGAYVTSVAFNPGSAIAAFLELLPSQSAKKLLRQMKRREISQVPWQLVHRRPGWELVRTALHVMGASPIAVDKIWDRMSRDFDAWLAARYVPHTEAIQCFEYTALGAFERAKDHGVAKILHLPSLDSKAFEHILRREKRDWKELSSPYDKYFEEKFDQRYARRQQEIALADVIICNSNLTARSHIAAGADPKKVYVCNLGAPTPIALTDQSERTNESRPLRVVWAGPFSLRKGAHYMLAGWKALNAKSTAVLNVYGMPLLPERLLATATDGVIFHGSVPQSTLFEAFKDADLLVFPTLSDGYGMVVAEAMAHGLPVITTNQAGAADLVTNRNGIIITAADSAAITEALTWCLDNREQLSSMRQHALDAARARQWSHFRADLIQALRNGLSARGFQPKFATVTGQM